MSAAVSPRCHLWASKDTYVGQVGRQSVNNGWCARRIRSKHHILRRYKYIEWGYRANRPNVVATNREFITEEEALEDRHSINEGERIRVAYFRRGSKAAYRSGNQAEAKNLGMLRFFPAHRNELRVRQRWLVGANVTAKSCQRYCKRKLLSRRGINAGVTGIVSKC